MKLLLLPLAVLAAAPFVWTAPSVEQESDMATMMAQMQKYTSLGDEHELLAKFIGDWDATSQITMAGAAAPPASGKASFRWKAEGRWLEGEFTGTMMGFPLTAHSWLGYDKFKMSYVWTGINTIDTAMNHAEGDMTPDGKSLILYGTLDEYLTGEHDKMVKYAFRFLSDDEIVLEVHDLPIGEKNTKVVEFRYTRSKGGK